MTVSICSFFSVLSQYPVLFASCISMVVFAYASPYKSKMANRIEAFLAVDSFMLLLLAMPNTVSKAMALGIMMSLPAISHINPCSSSLYIDPRVIFIAICYYVPLLVFLLVPVVMVTQCLWYVRRLRIG